MGHHIDDQGRFQSDKYPNLPPDKVLLSFQDPAARSALREYALYVTDHGGDHDFADDIITRLSFWRDDDIEVIQKDLEDNP